MELVNEIELVSTRTHRGAWGTILPAFITLWDHDGSRRASRLNVEYFTILILFLILILLFNFVSSGNLFLSFAHFVLDLSGYSLSEITFHLFILFQDVFL